MCTSNNQTTIHIINYKAGLKRHPFRRENRPTRQKTSLIMHKTSPKAIQTIKRINANPNNLLKVTLINNDQQTKTALNNQPNIPRPKEHLPFKRLRHRTKQVQRVKSTFQVGGQFNS